MPGASVGRQCTPPGRTLAPAGPACLGVGTLGQAGSRKCPRALGMDAELLVRWIGRESASSDLVISVLHHDQWASQLSLLWAGEVARGWAEAYNTHPTVYKIDSY